MHGAAVIIGQLIGMAIGVFIVIKIGQAIYKLFK